jgi:hypothetical protein
MDYLFNSTNKFFSAKPKDNPKDRVELEVGDSKDPSTFQPQLKLMRWDNEVNFSLRFLNNLTGTENVIQEGDRIIWEKRGFKAVFYDKPEASEEGGYEFEIHIPRKPPVNTVTFSIQTKELDFFYQPEITDEEAQEISIQQGISLIEAKRQIRPENVVGSYAVYHKSKQGNYTDGKEYKTGKAFHIYRPHVKDSQGNETWADLSINEQSGTLTITIDQAWLNKAVYPIIVDPTFGYTSAGASGDAELLNSGDCRVNRYTAPTGIGTASNITAYVRNKWGDSINIKGGIWLQSNKALVTNAQGGASSSITGTSFSQWSSTFSTAPSLTGGTDYYIGAVGNGGGGSICIAYDSGWTTNYGGFSVNSYTTFTALDATYFAADSNRYSIYATYTASATSKIKKLMGIEKAKLKKISGIAIASIKKLAGVANT